MKKVLVCFTFVVSPSVVVNGMNCIFLDSSFIGIIVHSECSTDAFISSEKEIINTTNGFLFF